VIHLGLILHFRYLILVPLFIIEGPALTFIAAILCAQGYFESSDIIIVAVICNIIGDYLHYLFGRYGGIAIIEKWGKYIHVTPAQIALLERHFEKHGGKTLILGKLSVALGSVPLMAAGVAKYSQWKFLLTNLVVEIPKTFAIFEFGFYLGAVYNKFNLYSAIYGIIFAAVFITISIFIARKSKSQLEDMNQRN